MERLSIVSSQPNGSGGSQDANHCISLCYQPVNVQALENQTTVAVQSLIDSQVAQENQDDEEDIFQCGKCKKQFTSLQLFVNHKQTPCMGHPQNTSQHLQPQQTLAIGPATGVFTPTLNINRSFTQAQVNGVMSSINTNPSILQAHPCLTRSLNQPTNATISIGGVPSSPISQLPQNMIFADELMALANLDASTIQMVTGPVQSNNSNAVTILSPLGNLTTSSNGLNGAGPNGAAGQLLMQPTQHITLTTIEKAVQQAPQFMHQQHQQQQQHHQHQHMQPQQAVHQQTIGQQMPPPATPATVTITPVLQTSQSTLQQQIFKPSPTKAGRKSAQNFITILNSENSNASLLSTRKGKTVRNINDNVINIKETEDEEAKTKPKLRCEYCSKTFTKNFDLQQHIRAHTGEKPFQCIVCGRAFAQKSNVKKHMATHKVWPCGISNTLPKQPDPVEDANPSNECEDQISHHEHAAIDIEMVEAETVDETLPEEDDSIDSKDKNMDSRKMKVIVDNSYVCQYCPAKFKTYYQLKTHLVDHKNEQVYKCMMKKCGQPFHDLDMFLDHVKSHENEMTYRCHKCHKYFPSLYDLGVHQYSHNLYPNQGVKSGPRHFQCTKCGNKYTTPESLEHHLSTTSHNYRCPHCEKQFTCERFLRRHLPIHGTDGQFECPHCQKRFKTEHYLKSHILIHTGENPFSCEICHACFNRKDKLKRHMTIHEAIKKYRCPFKSIAGCTKEFNRPDKLKAHIITHSGIKPHKCSICQKGFSRKPHLLEHERGHKADYKFKCEKCGKGFFRPKLFNEHKCSSTMIVEQTFRPRNKRKIGRPKKRLITVSPDSVAKCRGKRYHSRTRGGRGYLRAVEVKTECNHNKMDILTAKEKENSKAAEAIVHNVVFGSDTKTLSVELPLIANSDGSSLIDDDGVAVDVDHYVVHLSESVNGSVPSIETTFIPAGSGNQIFATDPTSNGIHPIAIIEATAVPTSSVSASIDNALMANSSRRFEHEMQGNMEATNVLIALSKGTHVSSVMSDENAKAVGSFLHSANKQLTISSGHHQNNVLMGSNLLVAGCGQGRAHHLEAASLNDVAKGENVIVIKNEHLDGDQGMCQPHTEHSVADMAEVREALALFSNAAESGGLTVSSDVHVTSSQNQAFLTCSSQLVDYNSPT